MSKKLRVTVWHEYRHELKHEAVRTIYPEGMHTVLAGALRKWLGDVVEVRTATLDQPEHGIPEDVLATTDVMTWWGHMAHKDVEDTVAEKVQQRVLEGMGIVFLHSAHYSKPFRRLMGTGCGLRCRDSGELERLYVVNPGHEIADGLPAHFEIPHEEMYGEFFDVPAPDELVMISWFEGGNVFRSCCTWNRGKGKVVYFRPGHESFPTYHQEEVQRVIANAVRWAAPRSSQAFSLGAPNEARSLSPITSTYVADESLHRG
jgi:trehalose utilization protein